MWDDENCHNCGGHWAQALYPNHCPHCFVRADNPETATKRDNTMEYADFLFNSLQDANAEIKRAHAEIERLTGQLGELRLNNQALERHLREAEHQLKGNNKYTAVSVARSLAERGIAIPEIAQRLRMSEKAVEDLLQPCRTSMEWKSSGMPSNMGWYAVTWCYDANEGMFPDVAWWNGAKWKEETAPIVLYAGPFEDRETALKWARENDIEA